MVVSLLKIESPIGIFDSGMGGISVLSELIKQMPTENLIYYGDSLNAPYGIKSKEQLVDLSLSVCDYLIEREVKAIVVACNTATSAAINEMRGAYPIPIIGMEPALKPATQLANTGMIAVLATEVTLKEKKFDQLMDMVGRDSEIIKIPCPNLVTLVESGVVRGEVAEKEILKCLEGIPLSKLSSIVLGCTHFVFLKECIQKIVGSQVKIFDGNDGTVKNLKAKLEEQNLCNQGTLDPKIEILNSMGKEMVERSKMLLSEIL